jgi:hypothetical protein
MPTNLCEPLFKGGEVDLTVRVTAAVVGKTFGAISADIQSGPAITTATLPTTFDGGNLQMATCGAGLKANGVFAYDAAINTVVPIHRSGAIVPVTAGSGITAGQEVQSDAAGKAVPLATISTAAAVLELGLTNSKIKFTAADAGFAGNGISIRLKDPAANTQSLSVTVTGNNIVVNLATDGAGAITSTVATIVTAVNADGTAASLVTAANGTGSNGTGVVVAAGPTNLAGGHDPTTGIPAGVATTTALTGADCFIDLY